MHMLQRFHSRPVLLTVVAGLLGGLASCGGEPAAPGEPPAGATQLYWDLTLNEQAINLSTAAPLDTFRLVATPRRGDGTPIEGLPAPTFVSQEREAVLVGPDGLVRGLATARQVRVIVTLTDPVENLSHVDTAVVSVTSDPAPPVPARISLEPNPADSAKGAAAGTAPLPYGVTPRLVVRAFDAQENPISTTSFAVRIESSDPLTARYGTNLDLRQPGPVRFIARTVAYGVPLADTLDYTVGHPLGRMVITRTFVAVDGKTIHRFDPAAITVGTGAHVLWYRAPGVPSYDVTFDDPTNAAADQRYSAMLGCGATNLVGNIAQFGDTTQNPVRNICSRHFPVPGTYTYHSAALNASGTIVVVDESQAPPAAARRATTRP